MYQASRGGGAGEYSGFQVKGMIKAKIGKKIPRASNKTKKKEIPRQKNNQTIYSEIFEPENSL